MVAVAFAAFAVDILLKIISRAAPTLVGRFSYTSAIGDFGFVPSTNAVLAFSLPIPNGWIWPIGWVVVAWLIAMLLRNAKCKMQNVKNQIALLAVILGALSNLIDRTLFGGVTDYLSFSDLYPAFNIADLLIIIGIVWWAWSEHIRAPRA